VAGIVIARLREPGALGDGVNLPLALGAFPRTAIPTAPVIVFVIAPTGSLPYSHSISRWESLGTASSPPGTIGFWQFHVVLSLKVITADVPAQT
jgi:hypothetical protein